MSEFLEKKTKEFIDLISEHTDSIRVFISTPSDGQSTDGFTTGSGNWYAQYGQIKEWVSRHDERVRHDERKQIDEEKDE